ncbi:MAG TPA: lysine-sensitive aspartokinase 3 [Candidatus Acidoferrales bacterium]|nr:lysine-sensitive aspartokinase 3 [Candidatus Acidoferrales bacterium]
MIVMKFGGTSLESAEALERAASIVRSQLHRRPTVVVSAFGKTTDSLLAIGSEAASGRREEALAQLSELREYHRRVAEPLTPNSHREELAAIIEEHFFELADFVKGSSAVGGLSPRSSDLLASYGERLSGLIVALVFRGLNIPTHFLDSRRLILTDERFTQARPLLAETYARIAADVPSQNSGKVPVLGGFIGSTGDGTTTTLGRGGSDFTASLVGAALAAEEIQIWTDVDGVLTSDPTLVPEARPVRTISFDEAAELAYFGAKVLHPATVIPAREKNIPVRILNSRRPEAPGTVIVSDSVPCSNVLKSVACKRHITVVNIYSTRMLMAHGFLRHIFEIFDRHETPVDMLASSEVSVSLTIDNDARLEEICAELQPFSEVDVEKDQAIICVVGDDLRYTPGIAARVFGALRDVNVRMISQGASLLNLSLVVAGRDLERAAASLHREFFSTLDPAVFG